MKRTTVAKLETHLDEYPAQIRTGETFIVFDNDAPIARLAPYDEGADGLRIREPLRPVADLLTIVGVKPTWPIDVMALLRASRDDR